MQVSIARIECSNIQDFESLHDEFNRVCYFPDFYGRNMDAWIDCMSCLDDSAAGMTGIHVSPGSVLTIELIGAKNLRDKHPELYAAIVECSAFVNWRRVNAGETPVIALAMDG